MDRWDDRDDLEGKVKGPQGQIARLGMGGFVKADSSKLLRSIFSPCCLCILCMVLHAANKFLDWGIGHCLAVIWSLVSVQLGMYHECLRGNGVLGD